MRCTTIVDVLVIRGFRLRGNDGALIVEIVIGTILNEQVSDMVRDQLAGPLLEAFEWGRTKSSWPKRWN